MANFFKGYIIYLRTNQTSSQVHVDDLVPCVLTCNLRIYYIYIYIYIYSLYKGEWTTYVDLNPLLTRRVSAYAFFRGLNCVWYYR